MIDSNFGTPAAGSPGLSVANAVVDPAHEERRHRINSLENKVLHRTRLRHVSVPGGVVPRRATGSPWSAQEATDTAQGAVALSAVAEPFDRQAGRCDWPRHTSFGSAAVSEPPQSEPERTGPRHMVDSSSAAPLNLKEDLLRIVKQMEFHREEIQAHQRQLSTLEQQHAELIASLPGARATDDTLSEKQVPVMQNARGLQGASAVDTVIGEPEQVSENLAALLGVDAVVDEARAQLEAAEARLGLQGVVHRPRSASSGRKALCTKARRPGSASSTLSGPAVLALQGVASDDALRLRGFQHQTGLAEDQELGRPDLAEATAKTGEGGERPGSAVLPWKRLFKAHWEPR